MAKAVRLTPAMSESRTPSAATAPPMRTTGTSASRSPAPTAVASGASDRASAAGPTAARALTCHDGVDHERDPERPRDGLGDRARRIGDLLAEGRDAGVAGEREEQQPGRAQDPVEASGAEVVEAVGAGGAAEGCAGDDERERDEDDGDDDPGDRAVLRMPRWLTAVSPPTAATAMGRCQVGAT
jgi:hypothetical protein